MDLLHRLVREMLKEQSGMVDLYHFCGASECRMKPEEFTISPESFSSVERRRSSIPRSWFYIDPADSLKDDFFIRRRPLYHVQVPSSQLYDARGEGKAQWENKYGYVDQNKMFSELRERFLGAFVETPGFPAVVLFKPITGHLVDERTKASLMGQ